MFAPVYAAQVTGLELVPRRQPLRIRPDLYPERLQCLPDAVNKGIVFRGVRYKDHGRMDYAVGDTISSTEFPLI